MRNGGAGYNPEHPTARRGHEGRAPGAEQPTLGLRSLYFALAGLVAAGPDRGGQARPEAA